MKELKVGEIVRLEGRLYKIEWSKWDNGKKQGNRAILKLLNLEEVMTLVGTQDKKKGWFKL